jgi:hypothetical protein
VLNSSPNFKIPGFKLHLVVVLPSQHLLKISRFYKDFYKTLEACNQKRRESAWNWNKCFNFSPTITTIKTNKPTWATNHKRPIHFIKNFKHYKTVNMQRRLWAIRLLKKNKLKIQKKIPIVYRQFIPKKNRKFCSCSLSYKTFKDLKFEAAYLAMF